MCQVIKRTKADRLGRVPSVEVELRRASCSKTTMQSVEELQRAALDSGTDNTLSIYAIDVYRGIHW